MNRLALALATWFGFGYSPVAPGTAGAAAAAAIAWLATVYSPLPPWAFAVLAAALTPVGIWAANQTARIVCRKDPGIVVIDEVLGVWITLAGASTLNWKSMLAGFLLFRLFDIWKPWPVRQLEALRGGAGIIADDLMAGVYGALVLWIAGWFNLY
ncbi:MAG: phosphatidylglycerophosphatase A [Bryobacterales bacterium]|nr:phosphatidylglycerophosphatase A [Bryobacterales bacterium]